MPGRSNAVGGAPTGPRHVPGFRSGPPGAVASRTRKEGVPLTRVTARGRKFKPVAPRGWPSSHRRKMGTTVTAETDPAWEGLAGRRSGGRGGNCSWTPARCKGARRPPSSGDRGARLAGPGDGPRAALTRGAARWRCRPAPGGGTGRRVPDGSGRGN